MDKETRDKLWLLLADLQDEVTEESEIWQDIENIMNYINH